MNPQDLINIARRIHIYMKHSNDVIHYELASYS